MLNDAYRAAVARKRLRLTLAAAVFVAALIVAAIGAEVNLRDVRSPISETSSAISIALLTLESGARVWTDLGEWFWGWRKWLCAARRDHPDQLCRHRWPGRSSPLP